MLHALAHPRLNDIEAGTKALRRSKETLSNGEKRKAGCGLVLVLYFYEVSLE